MYSILQKTLGGLSPQYYFRQLFFGIAMFSLVAFANTAGSHPTPITLWILMLVCTFLYPYSRFVYESVIGFLVGENVFLLNAAVMLIVKLLTMFLCWALSIFIAPIGLAYLYFHNSRAAS